MGEIADMMLEGVLCAGCGVALDQDEPNFDAGFPVYCSPECAKDHGGWYFDEDDDDAL